MTNAESDRLPDREIVQQAVAQFPCGHNCTLLDKLKDPTQRLWYARQTNSDGHDGL